MPRRLQDLALGVGVIAFALVLIFALIPYGISRPSNIRVAVLSPAFWPNIVAWGLMAGGGLLVAQHVAGGRAVEETEEPDIGASGGPWLRLLALAAIMTLYYAALPWLGMVLASVAAFLAVAVLGRSSYRITAILVAILLPLAIYVFFSHVAGVPVPQGRVVRLP